MATAPTPTSPAPTALITGQATLGQGALPPAVTDTSDTSDDYEAPLTAEDIQKQFSAKLKSQADMGALLAAAQEKLKAQRAPSLGASIGAAFSQGKTSPGLGGTLQMLNRGLSSYDEQKRAFDAAQAENLLKYQLQQAKLTGDQAGTLAEWQQKLAQQNALAERYKLAQLRALADMNKPDNIRTVNPETGEVTITQIPKMRPLQASAAPSGPPPEAIQMLRNNPDAKASDGRTIAQHFDEKYGSGKAALILGMD